jgi:hypothetical protein
MRCACERSVVSRATNVSEGEAGDVIVRLLTENPGLHRSELTARPVWAQESGEQAVLHSLLHRKDRVTSPATGCFFRSFCISSRILSRGPRPGVGRLVNLRPLASRGGHPTYGDCFARHRAPHEAGSCLSQ